MQTVAIIGLGLIGGSLGLALCQARDAGGARRYYVSGYDHSQARMEAARQRGALDQASANLADAVQQADLLMIATPVLAIRQVLAELAPLVRPETIITDTASTKAQVMRWASELLPAHARFIGGHPMAGSTGSLEEARADLFAGSVYCLVPHSKDDLPVPGMLADLITTLGATPLLLDAATHDRVVAAISHLPFLAAVALVETLAASDADLPILQALASSGFRDATRLAGGDPTMYHDISLTNREAILPWLDAYLARLHALRQLLHSAHLDEQEPLRALFREAQQHQKLLREKKSLENP
jgi:prephenate dehydrogenase